MRVAGLGNRSPVRAQIARTSVSGPGRSKMAFRLNATACALGAKAGATVVGVASLTALGVTLAGGSSHDPVSRVAGGSVVVSTDWPVPSQPPWSPQPSPSKSAKKASAKAATHAATHAAHQATAQRAAKTPSPQPQPGAVLAAAIRPPASTAAAPTPAPPTAAAPTTASPATASPATASPVGRVGWWHGAPPSWSPTEAPQPSPSPSPTCQDRPRPGKAPGEQADATITEHAGCTDPTAPGGPGQGGGSGGPGHGGPGKGDPGPGHGPHHGPGGPGGPGRG